VRPPLDRARTRGVGFHSRSHASYRALTTGRQPPVLQLSGASPEVLSPSALEDGRVHSTRACLTRYVPPPGFLTLLAAFSPPTRPALFQAGGTHGVGSLQSFTLRTKPPHLSVLAALLTLASQLGLATTLQAHRAVRGVRSGVSPQLPGHPSTERSSSGRDTSPESVTSCPGLAGQQARCSPGVLVSPGLHGSPTWDVCLQSSSSHGLPPCRPSRRSRRTTRSPARWPSGVSLGQGTDATALAATSALLRFFNLVSLLSGSKSSPTLAHGFASGLEPRHRAPQTLFESAVAPAGAP
jgi:hypothetical protein